MAAEQFYMGPFHPTGWGETDTSTPNYITQMLARLGDIERRLEQIERALRENQGH